MIIEILLELIKIQKEECIDSNHTIVLGFELFRIFKEEIQNKSRNEIITQKYNTRKTIVFQIIIY